MTQTKVDRYAALDALQRALTMLKEHFQSVEINCIRTEADGSTWSECVDWPAEEKEDDEE